ncbi:hypothetical protein LBMAG42_30670 [Deltaproteobacteria bacterium]|nr:hypothetical protein LBMAG42_30670 [Deltaproteobacteria bacterium]
MILGLVSAVWAGEWAPVDGERLSFAAEWMGIRAGTAVATTRATAAGWSTELITRSDPWLEPLYPIDDTVGSHWSFAGSAEYRTRYREGRFQQDQTMRFDPSGIEVARRQLIDGAWKDWSDRYDPAPGVFDPVAAIFQLRGHLEAGTFRVFSGKRVVPVVCVDEGVEVLDGAAAHRIDLQTQEEGVLKDKIIAWFAEDATRAPLRAVVYTRAGPVSLLLTGRAVR